jgi:hypothetical protein
MLNLENFRMVQANGIAVEECRDAIKRVLDSDIFSGSRRLSDFFAYSANAALEGRTELDQYEIAEKVLGRTDNFDPWDDAAVRKLATHLRHKLDEYYAGPGALDRIIVALPRRSYVLRFRRREVEAPAPAVSAVAAVATDLPAAPPRIEAEPTHFAHALEPVQAKRRVWLWIALGALVGGVAPLSVLLWLSDSHAAISDNRMQALEPIVIDTRRGDLRGKDLDIAPDAVRIGPNVGDGEEAVARIRFTPEYSTQQAGVMAMRDADNYVRLGPHFKNRALLEFGFERAGVYEGPQSIYSFDPRGQVGQPLWLALRRNGSTYTAYVSLDGFEWAPFGRKLNVPNVSGELHAAVYAFNGRSDNPSTRAVFDHFGVGLAFHDRPPGPLRLADSPNWEVTGECSQPVSAVVAGGVLEVGFAGDALGCSWSLTRPAPSSDWAFSSLVDFEPVSGSSFAVVIIGSRAKTSLSRRDLEGRSIQLEQNNDRDIRISDFLGAPPVMLRMEKRGGVIRAMVSRDLDTFVTLPGEVKASDLGEIRRVGISTAIAHWTSAVSRPPARIYWARLDPLTPGILTRNVP